MSSSAMATSANDEELFRRSSSRYVHPSTNRQVMNTQTQHSKHLTNDSYYSTFKKQKNPALFNGQSSSRQYFNDNQSTYSNLHDDYWKSIMNDAVYFKGLDPLFQNFISIIYKNPETSKLSSINISKAGEVIIDSMSLERTSRYHPAIENLPPNLRRSNVRRALAVSALRYFTSINDNCFQLMIKSAKLPSYFDWDETMAGELATKMQMITSKPPSEIGNYLLSLGFTKDYKPTTSHVVDIVYNNASDNEMVEMNNELAFLIGEQLEHLFDPLTEYSPEPTEKAYKPPSSMSITTSVNDDVLIKSICNELITVQTNFTVALVQFLQRFIIPLRVKVLQGKIPNYNAAKLNQIFPPTIDEVTRINCIFLDMLKLALPYGSFEVLKACGTTIPYFYKAYMRHEAATKTFSSKYEAFTADISHLKNNGEILSGYDRRTIESTIYSSLNLPKIQLILDRLMQKQKFPESLIKQSEQYYQSCTQTISSFANDALKPYNSRIFTPTGKILTELASGWPVELQYGWLNRRVVALFDAQNMLESGIMNQSVIIMFSDHILFLDVIDEQYYLDLSKKDSTSINVHKPSVADILMHSLVNEVPFSNLPKLKVTKWCKISDVVANHYNFDNKPFVQFLTNEKLLVYKIEKYSGSYVNEVLSKSKILNKSQPFHLFKKVAGISSSGSASSTPTGIEGNSHDGSTSIYYTAHDLDSYKKEEMMAPFIVLLNSKFKKIYLEDFKVFGFVTLNFTDVFDEIEVEGLTCCSNSHVHYVVKKPDLTLNLANTIDTLMSRYFTLENPMIDSKLLKFKEGLVSDVVKCMNVSDDAIEHELVTLRIKKDQLDRENKLQEALRRDQSADDRRSRSASLDLLVNPANNGNRVSSTKITKPESESNSKQTNSSTSEKKAKRKSGFLRFFSKKAPKEEKLKDQSDYPSTRKPKKRLSRLFLGGHTIELPPGAKDPLDVKTDRNNAYASTLLRVDTHEDKSNNANITGNSSSMLVNSKFEFPLQDGPEAEVEKLSAAASAATTPIIGSATPITTKLRQQRINDYGTSTSNTSSIDQFTKSTSIVTATTTATSSKVKGGKELTSDDKELTEVFDEINFEDIDYDVSQATSGELFNDEPEQPFIVKKTTNRSQSPANAASPVTKTGPVSVSSLAVSKKSPIVSDSHLVQKSSTVVESIAPAIVKESSDVAPVGKKTEPTVVPSESKEVDLASNSNKKKGASINKNLEPAIVPTIKPVDDQIAPSVLSIRAIAPPTPTTVKSPQAPETPKVPLQGPIPPTPRIHQSPHLRKVTPPVPPVHKVPVSGPGSGSASRNVTPNSIVGQSSATQEQLTRPARPSSYSGPVPSCSRIMTPPVRQAPFSAPGSRNNTPPVHQAPFSAPDSCSSTPLDHQFAPFSSTRDSGNFSGPIHQFQVDSSDSNLNKPSGPRNISPPSPLIPQTPQLGAGRMSPRSSTFGNSSIVQDHNSQLPPPQEQAELEEEEKENASPHIQQRPSKSNTRTPSVHRYSHPFASAIDSAEESKEVGTPSTKSFSSGSTSSKASPVVNYYSKFKKERLVQEDALKKNGITAIPESESHQVLAVKGLLYSPSIAKQLKNLVRETKSDAGTNWTTFTSREATLARLPTIPPPSDSPVFGNKAPSPALSNTSPALSVGTASAGATPKIGTARLEFYKSLHPPRHASAGTSGSVGSGSNSSQDTFHTPFEEPTAKFSSSLKKSIPDSTAADEEATKKVNENSNGFDDEIAPPKLINHFSLRETSGIPVMPDSTDLNSTNEKEEEENTEDTEVIEDTTEIQQGDSTFKEADDDGFVSGDDEEEEEEGDSDDGIDDDQARAGHATRYFTPKEHPEFKSKSTPKQPEDTTLCSALQDYEDQELLVDIIDGKRILSQHSINSLLLDDSYAYLGDFLAGDVTLDEAAKEERKRNLNAKDRRRGEDVDLDAVYANNLKDSSLWYLAGLVGGNGEDLK